MDAVTISLIISLIEKAVEDEPKIAAALKSIFSKADPTPADWDALRDSILANDYTDYVPDSGLPS